MQICFLQSFILSIYVNLKTDLILEDLKEKKIELRERTKNDPLKWQFLRQTIWAEVKAHKTKELKNTVNNHLRILSPPVP